jgi:hypothetical protein
MKMKLEHMVPLSTQAVEILRELYRVTGHGKFVFPSLRTGQACMSENTINAALRGMGFSKEVMTAHGFRATARTILDEVLNERVDLIEHQLAHRVIDPICPRRMGFDVEHDFGFQFWIGQHQLRVDGTIVMCEIDVGGSYEDAATFLLEAFPLEALNHSEAFCVMVHSSWKRDDQIRLARCYLRKMPFASATPYREFASLMSLGF